MSRITDFFKGETAHFRERLTPNARRLVGVNILKIISNPLTDIFLNAFIWQTTGSLLTVALFNVGQYIFLPIAFFVNGLLLRKTHIQKTFAWGAIIGGASGAALVIFGNGNAHLIPIFGCIWGFGNGMYWANRNYLELQETVAAWRGYFYGILLSMSALASILVPLAAGWFIVFGTYSGLYSRKHAYWMVFIFSFLLMVVCAKMVSQSSFNTTIPEKISRLSHGSLFSRRRILQIASGLLDGIGFFPTLLALYLIGNEGFLGSISAIAALCTVTALYLYARRANERHERNSLLGSAFLYLTCAVCLAFLPHEIGIIINILLMGVAWSFSGVATNSIFLKLCEEEMGDEKNSGYSFIFDNELFLNIGRLIAVGIVIVLALAISEKTSLFIAPAVIASLHVILVIIFRIRNRNE